MRASSLANAASVATRVALNGALAGGGALASWGVLDTVRLYGSEPLAYGIDRGGTRVTLFVLSVTYAAIVFRNDAVRRALPFYAVSYALLGATMSFWLRLWAKGFDDDPSPWLRVRAVGWMLAALAAAAALAMNALRAARALARSS